MQVSSAPSSPRTFLFVNTAGAVPGKASVARNISPSYSLRERRVVLVDICVSPKMARKVRRRRSLSMLARPGRSTADIRSSLLKSFSLVQDLLLCTKDLIDVGKAQAPQQDNLK